MQNQIPHGLKNKLLLFLFSITAFTAQSQPCNAVQQLSVPQQQQLAPLASLLDTALKYEVLHDIDSLSAEIKTVFGSEGGQPDAVENYTALPSNTNWISLPNAILLSRLLIANDSLVYQDIWKAAKGMLPPAYQPHSVPLRSAAEIAVGLLQIADNETDLARKALYQAWATRALDSLATMQLQSGAFPFPDLRPYGDPVFGPIIQNFLNACGPDSVNVLQNGWIIDDKGTGEFKFDAGVIGDAFYKAFVYTGNPQYKTVALSVAAYLKPLRFNSNFNYNTFAALGLARGFQLNGDITSYNRAVENLRYSVYPGQLPGGRWVDGHNANSRYHSLMIKNLEPVIQLLDVNDPEKPRLDSMMRAAVSNITSYTNTCGAATGFRWALHAYPISTVVIPQTLHDSVSDLIGKHIHLSADSGNFMDVQTMGEYLELLGGLNGVQEKERGAFDVQLLQNPVTDHFVLQFDRAEATLQFGMYNLNGQLLRSESLSNLGAGKTVIRFSASDLPAGMYSLVFSDGKYSRALKLIITR